MSNFAERLVLRSRNTIRISEIKPAITPDMVPEGLVLQSPNFSAPHPVISVPLKNLELTSDQDKEEPQAVSKRIIESEDKGKAISHSVNMHKVQSERKGIAIPDNQLEITPQSIDSAQEREEETKTKAKSIVNVQESPQSIDSAQEREEDTKTKAKSIVNVQESPQSIDSAQEREEDTKTKAKSIVNVQESPQSIDSAQEREETKTKIKARANIQEFSQGQIRSEEERSEDNAPLQPHHPRGEKNREKKQGEDLPASYLSKSSPIQSERQFQPYIEPIKASEDNTTTNQLKEPPNPMQQSRPELSRSSEPSVTIRIGSIIVRAITPDKPVSKDPIPSLSLQEYLKRRQEGNI